MLQYVLLIGDIRNIDFLVVLIRAIVLLALGRAFDLINRPAVAVFFEDIHRTVKAVMGERRLANDGRPLLHLGPRVGDHFGKVQLFSVVGRDLHVVSEKTHGQVANLVARLHAREDAVVQNKRSGPVFPQPCDLGALPETAVL